MKIGIIIHSTTGHTLSVAEKIKEKLISLNHEAEIEKIIATKDEEIDIIKFELINSPKIDQYDFLIFGAPVRAFNISPVISKYFSEIKSFENKKIICFVTMTFPFKWMGGKNAVSKMKNICEEKNGKVIYSEIISWSRKNREENINKMINDFIKYV